MTFPDAIAEALASGDEHRISGAVKASAAILAAGRAAGHRALREQIVPLAKHESPRVRQAVADACITFSDADCEAVLRPLFDDPDPFVRKAAARAAQQRAKRRAAAAKAEEERRVASAVLTEIEEKHGRAARKKAERVARIEKEYFAKKLHHELAKLATPLSVELQRLGAELDEAALDRGALRDLQRQAEVGLASMWSIVEWARASTSALAPTYREERLAALVDVARGYLEDRLGEAATRLMFENDVDATLVVHADRGMLLQALQNVIHNAADAYKPDAGRIWIRASADALPGGAHVALRIADRGAGMTQEEREALFEPGRSTKPNGAGVGLLIARRMIEEAHSGTLAIESVKGEGTTVTLTLPARQRGAAAS